MTRHLIAIAALLLVALSIAHYAAGRAGRRDVDRFLDDYAFSLRRPEVVTSARLEISDDFAAYAAADAAVRDAIEPVNLNDVTPTARQAWLDMVPKMDAELAGAQSLILRAAAERPGWPYHRAMLGRIAYVARRRHDGAALAKDARLWIAPLRSAMQDAPGDPSIPQLLASRLLETAPMLPAATVEQLAPVVARALSDRNFVQRALPAATVVYGVDRALAMLPDEPASLQAAFRLAVDAGAVKDAANIRSRWERAESKARAIELAEIERRAKRNDIDALRRLVPAWAARHEPEAFDTPVARRQLVRILKTWPRDTSGVWPDDRRAAIVSFFMKGRAEPAYANAISDSADALGNIPEPMQARLALLGGDAFVAEEIARASATAGAFEWTRFYVELARHHLAKKDLGSARGALGAISPAAQNECDVLLARRDVARASKDIAEFAELDPLLDAARPRDARLEWSRFGALSLCIDPWNDAGRVLAATIASESPALVTWGWNGAESGTFLAGATPVTLRTPLRNLTGRNALHVETLAGPKVTVLSTTLE